MKRIDRYRGCLLGGAVGDALGAPVEFMSRQKILARFGPEGITLLFNQAFS
jgi:ADP-ribosylglycohydrolase